MALITRISQLFKADMNAVLDQIEAPEQMLRQAIRDMEDEIETDKAEIAAQEEKLEQLEKRLETVRETASELEAQLDLCFNQGQEDLARKMVRRKLETERLRKGLVERIQNGSAALEKLRTQTEQRHTALEAMHQKAEVFDRHHVENRVQSPIPGAIDASYPVDDDDVEVAFLHEKSARSAS